MKTSKTELRQRALILFAKSLAYNILLNHSHRAEIVYGSRRADSFNGYGGKFRGYKSEYYHAGIEEKIVQTEEGEFPKTVVETSRGKKYYFPIIDKLKLPKGFRWKIDENGFYISRDADKMDYHPAANEIVNETPAIWIKNLEINSEKRKQQKLQLDYDIICKKDNNIWVLFEDARRAGNCAAGIISFAENQGIEYKKPVKARVLRRIAEKSSNKSRILETIKQAWMRETLVTI